MLEETEETHENPVWTVLAEIRNGHFPHTVPKRIPLESNCTITRQ
jgi:hypothetical protein